MKTPRPWMSILLLLAAAYNVIWGAWVGLFPAQSFDLLGLSRPTYLALWQSVGMIVGVYGVGYGIASLAPFRHWPIVFVGLLGKLLGPLGFLWAATHQELPWIFGVYLLTNDLIWWVPFTLLLWHAYQASQNEPPVALELALQTRSQNGQSLLELSQAKPTLTFFLRHFGCPFCRDMLRLLATRRAGIEATGVQIALVHMGTEQEAQPFFASFGLEDLPRFSDPERLVYRGLGISRGTLGQFFSPTVFRRRGVVSRQRVGIPVGDVFQLAGAFVLFEGKIVQRFETSSFTDTVAPLQSE